MRIWGATKKYLKIVRKLPRRSKLRLAWDLFMVWVALINLWMILFDLTYLWLRPTYVTYIPVVSRIYDPVKGIEPHPLTEEMHEQLEATEAELVRDPRSSEIAREVTRLRELTVRIVRENPFERAGQGNAIEIIKDRLAESIDRTGDALADPDELNRAAEAFWPDDPNALLARFQNLDPKIARALRLNYYRGYDLRGRPIDHFWLLDLPFLILFWIEFSVRWILALKRRTYARWFFFPIFNWYDVLGLIPVAVFRPFRLLRAVSMYMRLRRSELSNVGKDVFTRLVMYFSNIITEEVSDRVAIRILSEFAEEVSDGTHTRIARSVVEPRKGEIERILATQIRQTLTDDETIERLRSLVELNLANAVDESEALQAVPLPNFVLKPAVRAIGEVILDSTLETIQGTLDSADGEQALREVAGAMLDDVFYGPGLAEIEGLVKDITLQVLDHMQDVVKVKKWSLPDDQEKRPPMPWEPGALDATEPMLEDGPESSETPER